MAVHRIARGLDLRMAGPPAPTIDAAPPPARVALLGDDHHQLRARLRVREGDAVRRGQPLFEDRGNPGVPFVAPAGGRVAAVLRGERRALRAVVVDVDATDGADDGDPAVPPSASSGDALRERLVGCGLWTGFRTRPYSRVPAPGAVPHALFVTAIDTNPLAARPEDLLAGREDDFERGLRAVATLCAGPTYLCVAAGSALAAPAGSGVRREEFAGPHPAGTAGVHINRLAPVDRRRSVWHVDCQDVASIGHLLRTGGPDPHRVIAVCGPAARAPRLLRVRTGAALDGIVRAEARPGPVHAISGSPLDGRDAQGPAAFLGRFHRQLTLLREAPLRGPGGPLVPVEAYDAVMPMDVQCVVLLRALLAGDVETAERHGCLDLDEEDLALAGHVCPAGNDYRPLLRRALEQLRAED